MLRNLFKVRPAIRATTPALTLGKPITASRRFFSQGNSVFTDIQKLLHASALGKYPAMPHAWLNQLKSNDSNENLHAILEILRFSHTHGFSISVELGLLTERPLQLKEKAHLIKLYDDLLTKAIAQTWQDDIAKEKARSIFHLILTNHDFAKQFNKDLTTLIKKQKEKYPSGNPSNQDYYTIWQLVIASSTVTKALPPALIDYSGPRLSSSLS